MKNVLVLCLCFVAGFALGQTPPGDAASSRYTVILAGNRAGYETSARNADGSLQLYFEFNDRGRGPKITEHVVLDAKGLPQLIETSGNDYDKAVVAEHYSLSGGTAIWKNRAEQGSRAASDGAFYVSISGVPEESAFLVRAALAAVVKLTLLPSGEDSV